MQRMIRIEKYEDSVNVRFPNPDKKCWSVPPSELRNLLTAFDDEKVEVEDIDVRRKLIRIKGGNGRKDRYTILSEVALKTLREYVEKYKPEKWLFTGQRKDRHINMRTVQKFFENACKKTGITKDVTVHSLRHSFATHLLESGVDLRYIQELLRHKNSKTKEIYTHVAMKDLRKIRSPLDLMGGDKKNE